MPRLSMWIFLPLGLIGCGEKPLPPVDGGGGKCLDPRILAYPEGDYSAQEARKVQGRTASMPGVQWLPSDSVQALFGTRKVKLVLAQKEKLFLADWEAGNPLVVELSHGDESPDLTPGNLSSPLFSPDGNRMVFATERGLQGFVLDVRNPLQPSWRVPLSVEGYFTADPHWVLRNGQPWIYFANTEEAIGTDPCGQIQGYTYRVLLGSDSTVDSLQPTGLPGAFRGGLSRDGKWAGTAYSESALFDTEDTLSPILLADKQQKCNPSMNPFPAGSANNDLLMLLGFGGPGKPCRTPLGDVFEGLHQNLWIHDKDDLIIWQGRLPDSGYFLWDKPEWSTHPRFATSVAARVGEEEGDLNCDVFAVKLPDLSGARRDTLYQAEALFRLARGAFGRGTTTHLWIGE